MRPTIATLFLSLGLAAGLGAQDSRPGIAVLPFENGGSYGKDKEEFDALRRGLAAILTTELSQNPVIRLVDRERVQQLLEEQNLGQSERIDAGTAAKIGKLVGAKYMVAGTFMDLYGDFRIDARIIDTETGEIIKVVRSDPKLSDRKQMYKIVQSVAERIMDGTKLAPLPAAAATAARAREVPTDALAAYSRALLYQDKGDKTKAIEYYNKALAAFPNFTDAKEGLKRLGAKA